MKVEWHPFARLDLLEIVAWIAEDSEDAAWRLHDEIERQVSLLARLPEMGRQGRRKGTRELVIAGTAYLAPYRVMDGKTDPDSPPSAWSTALAEEIRDARRSGRDYGDSVLTD